LETGPIARAALRTYKRESDEFHDNFRLCCLGGLQPHPQINLPAGVQIG
jgi:hypothetical protein